MMENNLWNNINNDSAYSDQNTLYQNHIIEQYKLYVEMTDRISQRRNTTNVFFLTLNSTFIGALSFLVTTLETNTKALFLLFSSLIVFCISWWWLLRSYRNLNSAKFKVIGDLETKLPSSPYWKAEWNELGEGKKLTKYLPLSFLEQVVPILFVVIYILFLISFL